MPFRKLPGNRGMIYIPERRRRDSKHPCLDCFSCQWCSDDRCNRCRGKSKFAKKSRKK